MEAISKMSSCLSPARDILLPIHIKARSSPYPRSDVIRANVSDDKVYWQVMEEYIYLIFLHDNLAMKSMFLYSHFYIAVDLLVSIKH